MKSTLRVFCMLALLTASVFAQGKAPEVQIIDGRISMQAEAVPLGRVLSLLDQATGMQSRFASPDLANQNVSVQFSELPVDAAVRKVFEGQPLDYVLISGKGVVVTGRSAAATATATASQTAFPPQSPAIFDQPVQEFPMPAAFPGPNPPLQQGAVPGAPGAPVGNAAVPPMIAPGAPNPQQQQPAVVQTIFGAMPNPRADTAVPGGVVPGVQNPGIANPLGSMTPNPNPANTLFGNTNPAPFSQTPTSPPPSPQSPPSTLR